jgi:CRISPR-associated protein Cas2
MLFYVVTYDIPCDKRRGKVSKLLEGYGQRVQYSVFECVLAAGKYQELQRRLARRVNLSEDSVRFYPLSGHTRQDVEAWGGGQITAEPTSIIV